MSLRNKIILLIVPIIVTPMIISGWVSYNQLKATTIEKSQEQMETLLEQYALYADSLIHDSESNVRLFSNNEMLRRYMVTPSEEERYEVLQPLLMKQFQNYQKAYPEYYEFRLIFPDGFEDLRLVNRPIENLTMDEANTPFIKGLLGKKQGTYTRILINPENNELALYIATALSLKDRSIESSSSIPKFRGFLVLTIDISELLQQMELSKLGSDGFIFITNNQGTAELFPSRFEKVLGGHRVSQEQLQGLEVLNVITDVVGSGLDLSKTPIIETHFLAAKGYMKAIKIHDNFILVTWLPTTEIIAKTQELAAIVIAMTLLAVVITILLLFSSLNFFVLRPIRELRGAAIEIGNGVLNKPLDMKQSDEIGDLAYSFDEMRKSMLSSHEHLEQLVDERTTEVRQALKVAEKSSQEKSDFLSRMSHELRTPLNAIIGFSQLFGYDSNLTEHQKGNVREINEAGEHLLSLIDEVLDLSKIEAGSLELSFESISLAKVLSNCCVMTEPLAKAHKVTINFEHDHCDGLFVLADYIRIKQVVLNLMSNAVKYNKEYGSVKLYCTRSGDDFIRINVKDSGAGIPEDNMSQLFEPFNRLGAEYSDNQGTGIGLMITRQLVESMGGRLGVDSMPGQGSIFWVELKTSTANESSSGIEFQDEEVQADNVNVVFNEHAHILVAEDNMTNQEVLRQQLSLLGYVAEFADNGLEAFDKWQSGDYQLLLTDIHMPKMDGFELVEKIHNTKQYAESRIVIIAITADAMEGQSQRCIEVGMDDYIAKPVHMDELKQKLSKWLKKDSIDKAIDNNSDVEHPNELAEETESDLSTSKSGLAEMLAKEPEAELQAETLGVVSNERVKILVVEDNILNQELLQQQLNLLGYDADVADNGVEALDLLHSGDYQLLLTDIRMPKMDGFELVSNIRNSQQFVNSNMKIIAITADAMAGDEQRFIDAGMDDYIAKPVHMGVLKQKINKWMAKKSADEMVESGHIIEQLDEPAKEAEVEAVISLSALKKMVGDDPVIHQHILLQFVDSTSKDVDAIQGALSRHDIEALREQVHKLKGGAVGVGAIQLGDLCRVLEAAIKNQQWTEIETLVSQLDMLYMDVKHHVEKLFL